MRSVEDTNGTRPFEVIVVVCKGKDNAIGKEGVMPWHLPEDLRHFKQLTSGHTLLMGRKTLESIGRLLPDRTHLVVTRMNDAQFQAHFGSMASGREERLQRVGSIEDGIARAKSTGAEKLFIVGGGEIYAETLRKNLADHLVVTEIDATFAGADAYFPALNRDQYQETSRTPPATSEKSGLSFSILTFHRRPQPDHA